MAITYSISGGTDATKFNIDSASGKLTFKVAPDFENPVDANADNVYEVTVKATDAGGAATTQNIKVTVTDVSENAPPQITSAAVATVAEGATMVMTVTAIDPDGGTTPPPVPTGWPDGTNTGIPAGTSLTNSGSIGTSANGQVIDAKNVSGSITVNHNNVTIKRCKVTGTNFYQIQVTSGKTGCVVEDCEIDNKSSGGQGISGQGTFRRNNIHHCSDGINVAGSNVLIEDNWIHDSSGTADSHIDTIQADGGFSHVIIRHNTIINENSQTAGIMLDNWWGPIDDVLIENNVVRGGGYTMYLNESNDLADKVTNVRVLNNRLGKGRYGYFDIRANAGFVPVIEGNVDYTTGAPVNG